MEEEEERRGWRLKSSWHEQTLCPIGLYTVYGRKKESEGRGRAVYRVHDTFCFYIYRSPNSCLSVYSAFSLLLQYSGVSYLFLSIQFSAHFLSSFPTTYYIPFSTSFSTTYSSSFSTSFSTLRWRVRHYHRPSSSLRMDRYSSAEIRCYDQR